MEAAVEPPSFDPEVPSIARTYDYILGGKDNFPADRAVGDNLIEHFPGAAEVAVDNRECLIRAVRYVSAELGIAQFLELGSGLPAQDNVHDVARRVNPAARVVYVDNDPLVLAHGRALLAEDDQTAVIKADITDPAVLALPELHELLDFSRPVAVMLGAVLHHLRDSENPLGVVEALRAAVPAGSTLFITHFRRLGDGDSARLEAFAREAFGRGTFRTDEQIAGYFTGTDLVSPGIVPCAAWRPDSDPGVLTGCRRLIVAGLGIKRSGTPLGPRP
jgi:hypothetical protein